MKKIISIFVLLLMISVFSTFVYATGDGINEVIDGMKNTSNIAGQDSNIANTINDVIGLLQIAGTGISLIVVTMMGIKYMLASPSEKADTKKMIAPVLIGCVLLFGAVNIVAIIADFSTIMETN